MFLEIEHRLALDYEAFIHESFLELRMQPKTTSHQTLRSFVLAAGPPAPILRYRDWNDNVVHHFTVTQYHDRVAVAARSLVDTHPAVPALDQVPDALPLPPPGYRLWDFLQLGGPLRPSALLRRLSRSVPGPRGLSLGQQVRAVGTLLRARFKYQKNVTRFDSTTDEFLDAGAGVCQDFAHLALALLRLRSVPCRYVSGYLHVSPTDGEVPQSHAWIEFHSPTLGWVPFDPTHDREIDERYVVVGHGRHYEDVPPNKGIFRGNAHERLTAEVYTRPSAPKDVSVLSEEIEAIDLPVFQEIPERRRDRAYSPEAEAAAQQQRQQQQQ